MTNEPAPVLDPAQVADLFSLDKGKGALFAKFIGVFFDTAPERMLKIKALAQYGNLAGLAESAHSLRGAAGNVGAARFSVLLERIERAARGGDTITAAQEVTLLDTEFSAARAALLAATNP